VNDPLLPLRNSAPRIQTPYDPLRKNDRQVCLYVLLHLAGGLNAMMISPPVCRRFKPYETNVSVRRLHKVNIN